jgi:hypothetical protein
MIVPEVTSVRCHLIDVSSAHSVSLLEFQNDDGGFPKHDDIRSTTALPWKLELEDDGPPYALGSTRHQYAYLHFQDSK